ncbi:anaphase-promoting complex subunit cdc27 [Cichlidogyrus casuarinus]|uniref:Cell division cycle protein 27 homolog n=1 Tax=Cichlidogyrus casuarinus TaxID=1844966 RepID=A0ABD2QCN3_9PLAT
MGQLNDAKKVILGNGAQFSNACKKILLEEFSEQAAFVFQMLGDIFRASQDTNEAIKCYEACLQSNPLMWSCFEKLCRLKPDVDPKKYFRMNSSIRLTVPKNMDVLSLSPNVGNYDSIMSRENINPSKTEDFSALEKAVMCDVANTNQRIFNSQNTNIHNSPFHTPDNAAFPIDVKPLAPKTQRKDSSFDLCVPPSPLFACFPVFTHSRHIVADFSDFSRSKLESTQLQSGNRQLRNARSKNDDEVVGPNLRPRTRLQMHKAISSTPVAEISPCPNKDQENCRSELPPAEVGASKEELLEVSDDATDVRTLSVNAYLNFLQILGKAYSLMVQFRCQDCANKLAKIPARHLATTRLLTWAASCYMHIGEYKGAKRLFQEARTYEPWQLLGMDLYSTVLWHLKDHVAISSLAHELFKLDQNAPEVWCAAGNCFSLNKESHIAIKFFQQALKANPHHSYAAALLGHEFMVNRNMYLALSAFQHALSIEPRLYSALFGISNVYFTQEQYREAEMHLVLAVRIFPRSSELLTHLGVVRAKLGWYGIEVSSHLKKKTSNGSASAAVPTTEELGAEELFCVDDKSLQMDRKGSALHCFNLALILNPKNYLARFHRACLLYSLHYLQVSINELKELASLNPREPCIHILIGNAYNRLGEYAMAQIHFTKAMDMEALVPSNEANVTVGLNGFQKERVASRLLLADMAEDDVELSSTARSMLMHQSLEGGEASGPVSRDVPTLTSLLDNSSMSGIAADDAGSETEDTRAVRTVSSSSDELNYPPATRSARRAQRAVELSPTRPGLERWADLDMVRYTTRSRRRLNARRSVGGVIPAQHSSPMRWNDEDADDSTMLMD